jgi:excisionase family DNA binding protein
MNDLLDDSGWLSTREAADALGLSVQTLYRLIDRQALPAYRFGRVIRLRPGDVQRWLEAQRIKPGELQTAVPQRPLKRLGP